MKNVINRTDVSTTDFIRGQKGSYRVITNCRAGWPVVSDVNSDSPNFKPASILNSYKKGTLRAIEFSPEGVDYWYTVFGRKGNKIVMCDIEIMKDIEVGTINQLFFNTNLYNQEQYKVVGAKTWADKAFVTNPS